MSFHIFKNIIKLACGEMCNKMDKFTWTKTRPRKPGFYFYKSSKGRVQVTHIERLELVHRRGITAVMMVDGDAEQEIDRLPGQWAGPIPEPVEA